MRRKTIWLVVSCLMVVALLTAACASAEEVTPTEKAPVEKTPVAKEEIKPSEKEVTASTEGKDMIKVSLTKLDGTVMEKLVEKPKYGGRITFSTSTPVLAWDEAIQAPWTTARYCSPTGQNLLVGDWARGAAGTGEIDWSFGEWTSMSFATGQLAESWELVDDTTVIFHIRKGVYWHDKPPVNGRQFDAYDAVFNIKRIYFDLPASTMYGMVGVARPTDVYATDEWTVVLKGPPTFLGNTMEEVGNLTKMFPPEVIEKYGDMNRWENVVGTGPYVLTDYVPMSSVTWTKNPNYWGYDPVLGPDYPLPYPDELRMLIIPDRSTDLAALRTGSIEHSMTRWPWEDAMPLLKSNPVLESYRVDPMSIQAFGLRADKPELPYADIRVRRALLMAVNVQEMCETYYEGDAEVLNFKVTPVQAYKDAGWYTPLEELPPESKELYTFHPDKAKQLLTEAGYPEGFKAEVIIRDAYPYNDLADMLQYYWGEIGVDLTINVKEYGTYMSIYQKKTHPEILPVGRGGNVRSMYMCRKDNMYNSAMVNDPVFEQYFEDIASSFWDEPKRNKLVKEMNLYAISQAYYWTPPSPYTYRVWQPWLKNYHGEGGIGVYRWGNYMNWLWVDEDMKKSMK